MKKKRVFGELELAILQIVRARDKLTVRDVLESLQGDDKYTTVMTVMNRMVDKQLLKRERVGLQYVYQASELKRPTAKPTFLNKLKQKIFGGRSAVMVSYLLESCDDITDAEIGEIERTIQEMKDARKRP